MADTMEVNWGKPLNHTPTPSPVSQDAFSQSLCLYSYVWSHSDTLFEFTSFQARKGSFWPPEAKSLSPCYGPMYQLSRNTSEKSGLVSRPTIRCLIQLIRVLCFTVVRIHRSIYSRPKVSPGIGTMTCGEDSGPPRALSRHLPTHARSSPLPASACKWRPLLKL